MTPSDFDYRNVFIHAPVGMCVSRNRVIQLANAALEAMFGFPGGALNQLSFESLYPTPQEFERTGLRLAAAFTPDASYADERIMKRSGGELFWCHVTGRMLPPGEPPCAIIWTFEDLSARRQVASGLTPREREIAALIAEGKTSKIIARQLNLSPRTIEMYRARLMKKFGATTSPALIHRLMDYGGAQGAVGGATMSENGEKNG
jgi:PAS domain S-box-containing protein